MNVKMNPTREAVLKLLKEATEPMTLAEMGEALGMKVASGTTNTLVSANLIRKVGTKKVPVTTYREVAVYELVKETETEKKETETKETETKTE